MEKQNDAEMAETNYQNKVEDQKIRYNELLDGTFMSLVLNQRANCGNMADLNEDDNASLSSG